MDIEKVMAKIDALFSKTVENGCTQEEAELAAKMAQKLMAKYHIDAREYLKDDIEEESTSYKRKWECLLLFAIAENMCCKAIRYPSQKKMYITGHEADVKAVWKLYDSLLIILKKNVVSVKKNYKENSFSTIGVEASYAQGFINGLNNEMKKQAKSLILITPTEVEDKFHELHKNIRHSNWSTKNFRSSAYHKGYDDGSSQMARRALN